MSVTLTIAEAVRLVRKNLDELEPNGSDMYPATSEDNTSLNKLIERSLPEAINAVNLAAPVTLLDGVLDAVAGDDITVLESPVADKVLKFRVDDTDFLRLVAFKAVDSDIVVTDALAEASPEGRKQLKSYLRGRPDRPRLVRLQGINENGPAFNYYSLAETPITGEEAEAVDTLLYVREEKYNETTPAASYYVSQRLRQNILDYATGMVLAAMGDQRAQSYYQKAFIFA